MNARIAAIAWLMLAAVDARAQPELKALPIDVALDAPSAGSGQRVALAADHAYVAYTVCDPREKARQERLARDAGAAHTYGDRWHLGCRLEVGDTATGEVTAVTSVQSNSHGPSWSPDGRRLAYIEGVGAEQRLHVWMRDTRASRPVAAPQLAMSASATPLWLPDSRHVLVLVPQKETAGSASPAPVAATPAPPPGSTVAVYRSAAATPDGAAPPAGPWALDTSRVSLALVDTATGSARIVLARAPLATLAFNYVLSPDGRSVAYARPVRFDGPASQQTLMDVQVATLDDGRERVVAREVPMLFGWGLSWSPDSGSLAWVTAGVNAPYDVSAHVLATGATRTVRYAEKPPNAGDLSGARLTRTGSEQASSPVWDADGRTLYLLDPLQRAVWKVAHETGKVEALLQLPGEQVLGLVRHERRFAGAATDALHVFTGNERSKRTALWAVDPATGARRELWSEDAQLTGVAGSGDGRALAYFEQRADAAPDVWVRPLPAGPARRISRIAPDFDGYVFGKSRLIEWTTADGQQLQGVLILPADYRAGQRYPLVAFPYGRAYRSHNAHAFAGGFGSLLPTTDNLQLLATRGYAVLLPDAPMRTGTPLKDYAETIMPGVDAAIESGVADPDRLGVMGHSNGGYTVMTLIVQTGRFKAAVARAGMSDLASVAFAMGADGSNYGLNVVEGIFMGASLWEDRARWIDNSPLFAFDRVQTPTLIVHGGADTAVDPFAADQSFVALRRLDKVVEYAKYAGEGHNEELWSRPNRVDYLTRVIGWFDRFLCPQRRSETACQ